jgi:hypothetical protein
LNERERLPCRSLCLDKQSLFDKIKSAEGIVDFLLTNIEFVSLGSFDHFLIFLKFPDFFFEGANLIEIIILGFMKRVDDRYMLYASLGVVRSGKINLLCKFIALRILLFAEEFYKICESLIFLFELIVHKIISIN